MEAAEPIKYETKKPILENTKIDFIEELSVKQEKEEYKIKFGIKDNYLAIKVENEISKNINYYLNFYTLNEFQNFSMIFSLFKSLKDIISFLKNLKYEIEEKNEDLKVKFNIFNPDGKSKLIELNLQKYLKDTSYMIKYLLEEIKSIKINIHNSEENTKKLEVEIKELKKNNLNNELNYKSEISNLKEENKKLWEENNKLKKLFENINKIEKPINANFNSNIISIKQIEFIFDYIKENDKSFNLTDIQLLYRGSRDGDKTETCHQLCDNKQNVLIIIKSEKGFTFGGYCKIGFKTNSKKDEYQIDNNCFLFSIDLKKIYPVIKDKSVICYIGDTFGLCFCGSLGFYNNFMSNKKNKIYSSIKDYFNGLENNFEMNGGKSDFKCLELEVFQLL